VSSLPWSRWGGGGVGASAGTTLRVRQTNLVSDIPGVARITDQHLVNPWGLALAPTSPLWVANNGTGTATLYKGAGGTGAFQPVPLVVDIPGGAPTGQVFNGTTDFVVRSPNGMGGPAPFIFDSEAGNVVAWNPSLTPITSARRVVHVRNAIFKGLAIGSVGMANYLYATDFHHGMVDVLNGSFDRVSLSGHFRDPNLPAGYAPFGIRNLGGTLYVTFAVQDAQKHDELHGPGLGIVDAFDTSGHFLRRVATGGPLNAPWGLETAPAGWGDLTGMLLVGNFGDGRINAYNPMTGAFLGQLRDGNRNPIQIDGLWGLQVGNPTAGGAGNVWFSAGIADEAHGLLGLLSPID
jgi:uncharacterized protein (TIGR03118 family)